MPDSTIPRDAHGNFSQRFGYEPVPAPMRLEEVSTDLRREVWNTIRGTGMEGADTHLGNAAEHIRAGRHAEAVKDSILAVESVARSIDPKAGKTLEPALRSLEERGVIQHRALKQAFSALYGYANDEQGIRHALIEKVSPAVGMDESMFMLGACASFAAYLANKHRKLAGKKQDAQ